LPDRLALKTDRIVVVSDPLGDISPDDEQHLGLYHCDTRFLSRYELFLGGQKPVLLSSSVDRAFVATFHLVNATLPEREGKEAIPRQSVSIRRTRFISAGMHERIEILNCTSQPLELDCSILFDSDYLDILDVRSSIVRTHGEHRPPRLNGDSVMLDYLGEDGISRRTTLEFDPAPTQLEERRADYHLSLDSLESANIVVDVLPDLNGEARPRTTSFSQALTELEHSVHTWEGSCSDMRTDERMLTTLIRRAELDLSMLTERYETGPFPTAGIPFYAVPFGRDSIITAIEALGLNPELAPGTLRYLASVQGTETSFAAKSRGRSSTSCVWASCRTCIGFRRSPRIRRSTERRSS
jgi:glycogen debranching enzyme